MPTQLEPAASQNAKGLWDDGSNSGRIATYTTTLTPVVQLAPQQLAPTGGDLPHNNMQPYLSLNYCIALQGVFPARP